MAAYPHFCPCANAATFDFVPFTGDPQEYKAYIPILPSCVGPREGRGEVATSDFVPFVGDPRECMGDVALSPGFGLLRRQG